MAKFSYRARNQNGAQVVGEIEAEDRIAAKRFISKLQLIPIDVQIKTEKTVVVDSWYDSLKAHFNQIKPEEKMMFFQQLQTIYSVGVPLLRGLEMMQTQTANPRLQKVIKELMADIAEGQSMYQAMRKFPKIFDPITQNMIRVGEATGEFDKVLLRVSQVLQERLEHHSKIKSALFYPKIVFVMIGIVFSIIIYFVIPKFKEFFDRFGGELPPITRFIVGLSDFFNSYWYLVAALGFAVYIGFKKWYENPRGRQHWDTFILKVPVFGSLALQADVLTFCSLMGMLIRSGVSISEGLEVIQDSLSNSILKNEVGQVRDSVQAGETITSGFAKGVHFPKDMTNLISIGEASGELDKTLDRIAAFYKVQVDSKLNNLSKLIEPALLLIVFGMVLVLALAVFMPMWKMNSLLKK